MDALVFRNLAFFSLLPPKKWDELLYHQFFNCYAAGDAQASQVNTLR
jgi:hypothetical protein